MFADKVKIKIKAGDGGDGCTSFHTEKYIANGGPDGGDGGKGGDIIFAVDRGKSSLIDFLYQTKYFAEDGQKGAPKKCYGKGGADLVIKVPQGTVIRDAVSGSILADLYGGNDSAVILTGGRGGKGNVHYATSRRQAPHFCESGKKTDSFEVYLELFTIADVGLVGFPNVGKSTLLSVVSKAKPKIANYHFTTLSPVLGVVQYYNSSFTIADIPGLIEGASEGSGLGHEFLRHVTRTRLIVHLVDISGCEGRSPLEDYRQINLELKAYDKQLAKVKQIVALTKTDLLQDDTAIKEFGRAIRKKVFPICAITNEGVKPLLDEIYKQLQKLPPAEPMQFPHFELGSIKEGGFAVEKLAENYYEVSGGMIESLASKVNIDDTESFRFFQRFLRDKGVIKALTDSGAKDGDTVRVLDLEFDFIL